LHCFYFSPFVVFVDKFRVQCSVTRVAWRVHEFIVVGVHSRRKKERTKETTNLHQQQQQP
jgi:hypothetical protein